MASPFKFKILDERFKDIVYKMCKSFDHYRKTLVCCHWKIMLQHIMANVCSRVWFMRTGGAWDRSTNLTMANPLYSALTAFDVAHDRNVERFKLELSMHRRCLSQLLPSSPYMC
ncbi:hypothetical protein F2P81_010177 [Scophthalmus maximus]|uniref:Uncharacterized protein n=1 Tax=Scophthalmus maximus TaxID=52904 RepID=A0A6A4STL7_SCOMX|nr:hypothetical protein F2P81_010177 [Scophthalmus maximus]